ncbi:uncharacterized protein LOC134062039 [Sardina pilchardus]|uniref:uncharacterized protein LOC134062039 n=1 Tax=Sardina pilchardus TaxID=27697 RepID=UPI002E143971
MADLDTFYACPSVVLFDSLTKDQLVQLAIRYGIELPASVKRHKDTLKGSVKLSLIEQGVLPADKVPLSPLPGGSSFTYDQQRELLRLQLESKKVDRETTLATLEFQAKRLELMVEGKLPPDTGGDSPPVRNNLAGGDVWKSPVQPLVSRSTERHDVAQGPPDVLSACVVTRSAHRAAKELDADGEAVGTLESALPWEKLPSSLSREELAKEQRQDSSLQPLFDRVSPEKDKIESGYFLHGEVLVRKWIPHFGRYVGKPMMQIVIPESVRPLVLKTAHDNMGHLGVKKTYDYLMQYFYWPRIKRDVSKFIRTCHTCQLTGKPNQAIKPVPLSPIAVASNPFDHLIIDCVGPLPKSKSGNAYLLTIMCQTTRYPAAYPLRSIKVKPVVKALTQFISFFGIPKVIQTDRGSNFTSRIFGGVLRLLKITHNQASAYHPQSQGALERFHQTLKSLLRAYCVELAGDWEEGLPWLLLAAREVTQESTGFSPNALVFGHSVRGQLAALHDDWAAAEPPKKLTDYVDGFKRRLYEAGRVARENLEKAQGKMKMYYDRRSVQREFQTGDRVLALSPVAGSPFQAKFDGPYEVLRRVSNENYVISTPNRRKPTQLCHVNLLKAHYERENVEGLPVLLADAPVVSDSLPVNSELVLEGEELRGPDDAVLLARLKNSESLRKLPELLGHLPIEMRSELIVLINEFKCLFADRPSQTSLMQHDIDVGDSVPIRQRFYRVSVDKQKHLEAEVQYLLENDLAEPSSSSWASPCVLVNKPDGTFRFCTDYRKVNAQTKPDSFPLPRIEDCVDQVGGARFVSKFDLLKGYWQVPLTDRAREVSAFITPKGLFSYKVMSFGLRNAPASFQRLMNRVVSGLDGCAVYLDDVVCYSDTWEKHVKHIRALFTRLAAANLTVNLAKCDFARATVTYLGKVVGQGKVRPVRAKVDAIDRYPPPSTKKELMRFLGMMGFYRCFCRDFSTVVEPLTRLLKASAKFEWSASCQDAFESAKRLLTTSPVLMAPHFSKPFQLEVDASNVGAGAVLLQEDENGVRRPVSFFSRKFTPYQLKYAVIEKEALALIWGKIEEDERQERRRRQEELERRRQEEQRRRQQEELRRQQQQEREQRIQAQIDQENEACRQKLSSAKEKLNQQQGNKVQERHHQRTHVLYQLVEDDAAAIERDEQGDVEEQFRDLLSEYNIEESVTIQHDNIEDRMKTLQNELTIQYCKENNLSIWCQFTLDQAVDYEGLSLTDKFSLLKAVVQLTAEGHFESTDGDITEAEYDPQNDFLLVLLQHLYFTTPTLAGHLLLNIIDSMSELPASCGDILRQMVFNNIWSPVEIMIFMQSVSGMDQQIISSILHTAQTYRLSCLTVLDALDKDDPVTDLEVCTIDEPKDAETILNEMRESNYPESILLVLEDVLTYLETELPKYELVHLSEEQIQEGKNKIKSFDFEDPDMNILKEALLGMSIAVQDCTTSIGPNGEKKKGYFPRLTQLASLLMLLLSSTKGEDELKGCLLEIGTGEGKSCILAMFATIQAIREVKVDIVTSSPLLAIRDQEEWKKLYDKFGVTSSVVLPGVSMENHEKLVKDVYSKQIVFGTVDIFAADILKQEFEKHTTRGKRDFDLVIVDEVDYMTLDNGVQVTFLSHETSGMRHLEQVLANIWVITSACRPIEMLETGEIQWTTKIQHFHKAAFSAVAGSGGFSPYDILLPGANLGFFSEDDIDQLKQADQQPNDEEQRKEIQTSQWKAIETLMKKIGTEQQHDLLLILESATEMPIECYSLSNNKAKPFGEQKPDQDKAKMLLLENGCACQIMSEKDVIDATVLQIKNQIRYSSGRDVNSLKKKSENEEKEFMIIPSFLETYIENMLPVFVENALKAIGMSPGREYIIDKGPAVSDTDGQFHAIIPVDFKASGVLEKNKRWGDGLQQFLEMKHQLALSQISNVTNYMSNSHFFKRYNNGKGIFGVSGTLGGQSDQNFLARHYKTRSYAIPAHRHNKIVELPVIQVSGGNNPWTQSICETARKVAERGQVVLLICEDVNTANELQTNMKTQSIDPTKITMYTMSGRHNIEKNTFCGGNIIIATNLGGRGTDIKVDDEVNRCGGLFVLLTHFPSNRRVEKQVFGRTARKGNPGMVQMILCQDHLAPAYQGQSIEVMRHLREEYEVIRIADMEEDELLEIELKEELFSTFCKFLIDFDTNYTEEEKEDFPSQENCKHHPNKFHYQPALNALKESWALWLTLHEEHINWHDDITTLKRDLILQLEKTCDMLLQGKSNNFYDHIKQAIIRTDLHCKDRNKSDYGALSCWENIVSDHEMYSAVALYNQAFITINLQKQDHKSKAKDLLERAQKLVDVYISESSNTMVSCNMSVTSDFEPHHKGNTNFQMQMEVRMSIFKSWQGYIERALNKLKELKDNDVAIAKESSVYDLSYKEDYITTHELEALYDYGLGIVFEVKKKPRFCIDALICFVLGVLQVVAGVLVCALSFGTATQFGLGLISEGVSDMISGIKGMIDGSFSWAEWAISKAISIGMSLLSAGFSVIKKVCSTAKSIYDGTKTFTSVANDVIKSGKHIFKSVQGTAQKAFSGTFCETMKKTASSTALKQNFKHASEYAFQEIGKQAVTTALNYAVDKGVQAVFRWCLEGAFEQIVSSTIESNSDLDQVLTKLVCSIVPKAVLQKETPDFWIDKKNEEQMKELVKSASNADKLVSGYTTVHDVIDKLSKVSEEAAGIMKQKGIKIGIIKGINISLEIAKYTTTFVEILKAIPTSEIINEQFVPTFSKSMKDIGSYNNDGRHNLPDAKRLKNELLDIIAKTISESFIDAFTQHMTSISTKEFKKHLNSATGKAVGNVLGRYKTQRFLDDQSHEHNMKAAASRKPKPLSDLERMELQDYTKNISNEQRPATTLDLYVLTKSDLLKGKGIRLTVVDKKGKKLSEEHYPGTDSKAGEIELRLTKEPLNTEQKKDILSLAKRRILGEENPYSGHFDIVQYCHGKPTCTPVESKKQNCLYHAVAQATEKKQGHDIHEKAVKLRNAVQSNVQNNIDKYSNVMKLQKRYEEVHENTGKYTITGGGKRSRVSQDHPEAYLRSIKSMNEFNFAKKFRLGFVGDYCWLIDTRDSAQNKINTNTYMVNADHIPPKDAFRKALNQLKKDPGKGNKLKKKNPKLYEMIWTLENKSGSNLVAMEVLAKHHELALTTGSSHVSNRCRDLLCNSLVCGDVEKMIKQSLILAHPITSQELKRSAGLPSKQINTNDLTGKDTKHYYKVGSKEIVNQFHNNGIIDQNQQSRLLSWVQQDKQLNSPEYQECFKAVKSRVGYRKRGLVRRCRRKRK